MVAHGAGGLAHDPADLLAGVALQVVQHHQLSSFHGQPRDQHPQLDTLRPRGCVRRGDLADLVQAGLGALPPQRLEELPVGDAMQPGPQRRSLVKGVETAPGLEERLLGQVLGGLGATGEIEQVAIDGRVVVPHEAVAGLGVAGPQPFDKPGISGRQRI